MLTELASGGWLALLGGGLGGFAEFFEPAHATYSVTALLRSFNERAAGFFAMVVPPLRLFGFRCERRNNDSLAHAHLLVLWYSRATKGEAS